MTNRKYPIYQGSKIMITSELNNDHMLFNLDILKLEDSKAKLLRPVTSLAIFESSSKKFDPNGLFSTEIFGPVGSSLRSRQFGYINLYLDILHPLVYQHITNINPLYDEIMAGNRYAKFNYTTNDFELANSETGDTGYAFFLKYLDKINFKESDSEQRKYRINFIKKYSKIDYWLNKWLVLPAGLRDYEIDKSGTPTEDEVNTIYRALLSTTSFLANTKIDNDNIKYLDSIRYKIQKISLNIYNHFLNLLDGKSKFIQSKWAKRAIVYGTRNVITPANTKVTDLNNVDNINMNKTMIGVYQYAATIAPVAKHKLYNKFISKIMDPNTTKAKLVDPKTMTSVLVDIDINKRNEWVSIEGLDNIFVKLSQEHIRLTPVIVDGYYMFLLYDDGKNVTLFLDTSEITPDMKKEYIRPITYLELMFLAIEDVKDKYPLFITRYPAINLGSIYPSFAYLKTTINGRKVKFSMSGYEDKIITEYPILTDEVVTSVSPHPSKLGKLGADFDGDVVSVNSVLTEESIEEIKEMLASKEFYLTPTGELTYSLKTTTLELVVASLTAHDPE